MRLRAVVVMVGLASIGVAVANCGSEDGSAFTNGGSSGDGGSSTTPPAFGGTTVDGGGGSNSGCTKLTCADLKINCGPAGDGCGGLIENCGTCQGLETCGGGGTASVCGGSAGCVKKTCTDLGFNCGPAGDGCGGLLDCGNCQGAEFCGGGGPSKCGGGQRLEDGGVLNPDGGVCVPDNTCAAGACGPIANGCGGFRGAGGTCGGCPSGTSCGGGGVSSQCGAPACTRRTCQDANANCGVVADGCGGIVDCGGTAACTVAGEFCGGGGPNRCGRGNVQDAGPSCTNLCADRPTDCSGPNTPNTTTISGIVYMPNGKLPVYDALVYIPNGTVAPMPTGIGTCDTCSAPASGDPLGDGSTVRTNALGEFTLTNVPYRAAGIPIVIQAGRWRKQITVTPNRCGPLSLSTAHAGACPSVGGTRVCQAPTANNTTFGTTHTATNHIPKFAVTSGEVDALQCLLRKVGIADSEFTLPSGAGRVNIYHGSKGSSAYDDGTPFLDETALYGSAATMNTYDAVVLSCNGDGEDRQGARGGGSTWTPDTGLASYRAGVKTYADLGGRIFASHWHHAWLEHGPTPWGTNNTALGSNLAWIQHQSDIQDIDATINTAAAFTKGNALADWLIRANTLMNQTVRGRGVVRLTEVQHTVNAIDNSRVNLWISIPPGAPYKADPPRNTTNTSVQYFDFNTPVNAQTQCGRYVISDLHVASASSNNGSFPTNCGTSRNLSDQEKVLAFMLFDLTSCIQPVIPPPPPTPTCTPLSCAQQGIACGQAGNGCGATITCNACPENQVCQGNPPACVTPNCTPVACDGRCGPIANGCGSTINCGDCPQGQVCGGSGPNRCGSNSCTPTTCSAQNIQCGPAGNGCGGLLDCGPCPQGQTCGGGGTPGVCGAPACTPRTCAQANANCGFVANGCGGVVDCGPCPNGQSCGGNGTPNQCGGGSVPK